MRGAVPLWVLVVLGTIAIAAGVLPAQQPDNAKTPQPAMQVDSGPFAEEIRLLEAATEKDARRDAFVAIVNKAAQLKRDPDPLVSILRNKQPQETFTELLTWIKDAEAGRVACFLPVLVAAANEGGDSAKPALRAVKAYGMSGADSLATMAEKGAASERAAAIAVAGERVGGLRGVARVVPVLVKLANEGEAEFQGAAMATLRKITLLNFERASEWKDWLTDKTEVLLMAEIGDREAEARRKAEDRVSELEREIVKTNLERMRQSEATDPAALVGRMKAGNYPAVREEAAKLLGALLPTLEDDPAKAPIDALGEILTDTQASFELRKQCAIALAEPRGTGQTKSRKTQMAFAYIDRALETNGISADLKLELLKGLNSPLAAARLAKVLKAEIDVVETRSGALLETAISQVRAVLEPEDASENRDLLLGEFQRLLSVITDKVSGTLEAPARKRLIDLAVKTNDALQYLARLRRVDVTSCVPTLLRLINSDNGAANSALTTLRQAIDVPAARDALRTQLTTPPESDDLTTLYKRLLAGIPDTEPTLVNLLQLCEALSLEPEPREQLTQRLLDRARSVAAQLPPSPEQRRNLRDALRGLLARLNVTEVQHIALIQQLLDCEYGEKDALGYILVLPPNRVAIVAAGLESKLRDKPLQAGLLVAELVAANKGLTSEEVDSPAFGQFRERVRASVREAFGKVLETAIKGGMTEQEKTDLQGWGNGPLRESWVISCVDKLRASTGQTAERDAVAEMLLSVLKQAHPEKFDRTTLKGLDAKAFEAALDTLKTRLKLEGYRFP